VEYILALHQTRAKVHPNGSIKDEDIQLFFNSRFGIVVTLEQIRLLVFAWFCRWGGRNLGRHGGDRHDGIDCHHFDTLLLKAPILEGDGKTLPKVVLTPLEGLLQEVFKMIIHNSSAATKDGVTPVTVDLIKKIFLLLKPLETHMPRSPHYHVLGPPIVCLSPQAFLATEYLASLAYSIGLHFHTHSLEEYH
jgi:hypothetical protein